MAIADNTKKKLPDEEGIGANYGIPGGIVKPDSGKPKVFHSPSQPGLEQPAPAPSMSLYDTGRALRGAGVLMNAVGARALGVVQRPGQAVAGALGDVGRGFFGAGAAGNPPVAAPTAAATGGVVSAAQAAPREAGPAAPTGMHLIEPSNAASMRVAPPSAVVPSPAPAPAPSPAPASGQVLGQFNGRDITQEQAQTLAGKLPVASGPVAMGPNGSYAFTPPGAGAAAPGTLAGVAAATAPQQTPLDVSALTPPSSDTGRVSAAEQERAALVRGLDSQISRLSFGPSALNSRGERQLYAELLGTRAGLTQQVGDLAGRAATGDQDATLRAGIATQGERGANARAALSEQGANQRATEVQAGETTRAGLVRPEYQTTADGRVVLANGTSFTPVTDASGATLKAPATKAEGAITPEVQLNLLVEQLKAEQGSMQPDPNRVANLQQQIAAAMPGGQAAAPPRTATNPKTGQRVQLNPTTGQWEPIQ